MRLFDIAAQRARRARGARSYHRKFELASHITPLVQATSNKFIPQGKIQAHEISELANENIDDFHKWRRVC